MALDRAKMALHGRRRGEPVALCYGGNDHLVLGKGMVVGGRAWAVLTQPPPDHRSADAGQYVVNGREDLVMGAVGDQLVQAVVAGLVLAPSGGCAAPAQAVS